MLVSVLAWCNWCVAFLESSVMCLRCSLANCTSAIGVYKPGDTRGHDSCCVWGGGALRDDQYWNGGVQQKWHPDRDWKQRLLLVLPNVHG